MNEITEKSPSSFSGKMEVPASFLKLLSYWKNRCFCAERLIPDVTNVQPDDYEAYLSWLKSMLEQK